MTCSVPTGCSTSVSASGSRARSDTSGDALVGSSVRQFSSLSYSAARSGSTSTLGSEVSSLVAEGLVEVDFDLPEQDGQTSPCPWLATASARTA